MALQKHGRWLLWAVLGLATGCGSSVTISPDGKPSDPGDGGTPACPELDVIRLELLEEGTFVDGALHVVASADGGPSRWMRLDIDERGLFLRDELDVDGPSKLVSVSNGGWARLRADGAAVEALSFVSDLPQVETTLDLDGTAIEASPLTFAGERLHLCRVPADGTEPGLTRLGLDGNIFHTADGACSARHDGWAAAGNVWAAYSGGATTNGFATFFLTADGVENGRDFGYAPNGVHSYGLARAAFTDGEVASFDTGSDQFFLLVGGPEVSTFAPEGPYISFTAPGPKRLLTLVDGVAYFATPDGFVMYDVHDIDVSPRRLGLAAIELDPERTRFIAGDEKHIVFADGEGNPLVVPAAVGDAQITPAVARRGAPDACP